MSQNNSSLPSTGQMEASASAARQRKAQLRRQPCQRQSVRSMPGQDRGEHCVRRSEERREGKEIILLSPRQVKRKRARRRRGSPRPNIDGNHVRGKVYEVCPGRIEVNTVCEHPIECQNVAK